MGEDGKWEIARVLYLPMTGLARGWQTAVGSIHMPFNNLLPFHEFSKQTCVMSQTLSCKNSLHCCCFPIPHQIVQHGGVLFSQSHEMSRPSKGCPLWYLLLLLLLLLASQKVYLEFWGTGGGKQPLLSDLVSPQLTIDPSLCPPLFNWLGWPGPDQTVHKKDSYSCPPLLISLIHVGWGHDGVRSSSRRQGSTAHKIWVSFHKDEIFIFYIGKDQGIDVSKQYKKVNN